MGDEDKIVTSPSTRYMSKGSGNHPCSDFDETCGVLVKHFLERQYQPICLISHNEPEVTFSILANSITAVGVSLSPDLTLRCGNSFQAFQDLQPRKSGDDAYILCSLYQEAFGAKLDDKRTLENDTIALMKVVVKAGSRMWSWMDSNAVKSLCEYQDAKDDPASNRCRKSTPTPDRLYERYTEDCH
ncbi:three-prime repair exonuclease 1-like [Amphiura filiformis]|uniref:three-prime repair exonuclease 1-like n=1 Tax=Amphiura filiformis TaxID=82378 RepID=UPI003B2148ED